LFILFFYVIIQTYKWEKVFMDSSKKLKIILLIALIVILIFIIIVNIFGSSLSLLSKEKIKSNRKLKNDLISSIKINNIDTAFDKESNTYYYTVSDRNINKDYFLKLNLENGYKYKLVGKFLNVIKVDYNKPIDVIIYNNKYYYETKIQLTNLPLITITSDEIITRNDTNSVFKYISPNTLNKELESNSKIHIRGATSSYLPKSSYRITTYDKKYKKDKNILIPNYYYGSSFILDAVYKDTSKIRNSFSQALWNDISNDFTNVDIYSEFVEVFINNEYKGLYVLTEPVNRKKLNLNKSNSKDTSMIIKSNSWITIDEYDNSSIIDNSEYLNYEIKYPNNDEFYSEVWDKFIFKVSNYYNSNKKNTYNLIDNTWNINNYIDIVIFNAFTNNVDNQLIKNTYFYMESLNSDEIYMQPWDMEFCFGLKFSQDSEFYSIKDMSDYDDISLLFYHEDSDEINKLLKKRYWELRKKILTKENFDELLNNYKKLLTKGAAKRDSEIWYEYDVEKEIEEIRKWLHKRLECFDKYVKDM